MKSLEKFMQLQTKIDMAEKKNGSVGIGEKLSVAQGSGLNINAV